MDSMTKLTLICAAFFMVGFATAVVLFIVLRDRLIGNALDAQMRRLYGPTLRRTQEHVRHQPAAIDLSGFYVRPRHDRHRR